MNAIKTTAEKIDEIRKKKAEEVAKINAELEKAKTTASEAEDGINTAIESTNFKDFEKYTQARDKANAVIKMYTMRLEQLYSKKFITESESDDIIKDLLNFEDDLSESYINECAPLIAQLKEITGGYLNAVTDAEDLINTWTSEIHPNYKTFGRTTYYKNGSYTDRSDTPIPVHRTPFNGCRQSTIIKNFLDLYDRGEE